MIIFPTSRLIFPGTVISLFKSYRELIDYRSSWRILGEDVVVPFDTFAIPEIHIKEFVLTPQCCQIFFVVERMSQR